MRRSAIISPCGLYRYRLDRVWAPGPTCTFVMLNPSTADGETDDATIRRCIHFAKREACGSLIVVNLFAFRATNPKELKTAPDPIGPANNYFLAWRMIEGNGPLVAAWGSNALAPPRAQRLEEMRMRDMVCLGVNRDGAPRHPLYVPGDAPLVPFCI